MKRERDLKNPSSQGVTAPTGERGPDDDTKRARTDAHTTDPAPAADSPAVQPAPDPTPAQPQPFRFTRAPGFLLAQQAEQKRAEAEEERRQGQLRAEQAGAEASTKPEPRTPAPMAEPKKDSSTLPDVRFAELSPKVIARMTPDQLSEAIEDRMENFGGLTPDTPLLTFRQTALVLGDDLPLAKSTMCVGQVHTWLHSRAALVPDVIPLCDAKASTLAAPATPAPTLAELTAVWRALTGSLVVPRSAAQDGCEFLAHAVCEWFENTHPDWARLHLCKRWVVAPSGGMHPPYHWKHHVAPQITCVEGPFVIDLLLGAQAPMACTAWVTAAKGASAPADTFEATAPWELLGAPASATAGFVPETLSPIGATLRTSIEACKRGW
ncbi:hypothetical protein B4N89_37870 [Embleya scabrispora]|uniref:Protein glutaminase domain-containing protein n=1 Tax=Embleya scabrispora TaxID=159449 RepID=A0A1T3NMH2_9ACTN|nr:protein-glutamine glutaminase family protein [Embleya scabrispora]OPC77994.1 hypothetical protein B4N89_37870 [Embleya scabrispora]